MNNNKIFSLIKIDEPIHSLRKLFCFLNLIFIYILFSFNFSLKIFFMFNIFACLFGFFVFHQSIMFWKKKKKF